MTKDPKDFSVGPFWVPTAQELHEAARERAERADARLQRFRDRLARWGPDQIDRAIASADGPRIHGTGGLREDAARFCGYPPRDPLIPATTTSTSRPARS